MSFDQPFYLAIVIRFFLRCHQLGVYFNVIIENNFSLSFWAIFFNGVITLC